MSQRTPAPPRADNIRLGSVPDQQRIFLPIATAQKDLSLRFRGLFAVIAPSIEPFLLSVMPPEQVIDPNEVHQPDAQPKRDAASDEELKVGPGDARDHGTDELKPNDTKGLHLMFESANARVEIAEFEGNKAESSGNQVDAGDDSSDVHIDPGEDDGRNTESSNIECYRKAQSAGRG